MPEDPHELALAEEERQRIAEIEHHVLKLGREGFPPLGTALRERNKDALLHAFAPDFAGVSLDPGAFRDVGGGMFRTRLARSRDGGTSDVDAGQMADYLAANPDAVAHEGGGEQEAAAEQDAGATNSAQQDAVQARDEFVRPTPPTSRPTSRPASSSIRRPGGSKTGSRVGSPAPGASGSRPASATVPPA